MNTNDCFSVANFNLLKSYILENGSEISLHKRTIASGEMMAIEVSFDNKFVELIQHIDREEILIIDKNGKIPDYICSVNNGKLEMSLYAAGLENAESVEKRRNDWCQLMTFFLSKE